MQEISQPVYNKEQLTRHEHLCCCVKITAAGERFYLPSWLGPLLWPMHEQRLVHLSDCNPIVLAVKTWEPMQCNDNKCLHETAVQLPLALIH